MSMYKQVTMPGEVNTDIGVVTYNDLAVDVEITSSTTYDGYIYNVLTSEDKGKFFVQKISSSGAKDLIWGDDSTDFTDASFVIFTEIRTTIAQIDASNYAFTGCKLDKMYPQSISIHNNNVYIVGNTSFDLTDCSGVGGGSVNVGNYPLIGDYDDSIQLDWQGTAKRGFLTVLNLSDGTINKDYFNKAYGGDPDSVTPPQISGSEKDRFFASSATIYTSVNYDNQYSGVNDWELSRMPTPSFADSLYIYVTPSVNDGNMITDKLQANDYVQNELGNYLNTDTIFNCSTHAPSQLTGGDFFLIVGSEKSKDTSGTSPDECRSIVVRAYKNTKLECYDSFKVNNEQPVGITTTDGVLVIDPSGTSVAPVDKTNPWSASAGTVALQLKDNNGNGTFIMGGGCDYTFNDGFGTFTIQPPFLCKFDVSGVIDTSFSPSSQNLNYLDFTDVLGVETRIVTNISPNLPDVLNSLIVIKKTSISSNLESCVITSVDNSNGGVNATFGTNGELEPQFSNTTIVVGNPDLKNTNGIGVFANECYLALNSKNSNSGLDSGLVIKFSMDGDPSLDFGEAGYAFFGASNTSYKNVNTQSVIIVGYLPSAQASIALAFGGGANSPLQSIGIPFNLLPSSGICFPAGTPINTDQGIKNIEDISTRKNTINGKKINSITKTIMNRMDYLVVLEKDCIENNVPSQQTICSPDHKILYRNKMIEANLLIERKVRGVYAKKYDKSPLYNVLLDSHSTMVVNNMITETLHPKNPIAMLYSNIPQSVKKRAMIFNNLKENEKKLSPHESFLLQKHVPKPVFKARPKLEFPLKR